MGTFRNQKVGGGVVEVDDVDIGHTQNDIAFARTTETLDGEDYIPLQTTGRVIIKESVSIKIEALEITAENVSRASLNIPVTNYAGTPVTVAFFVSGDDPPSQARTFKTYQNGSLKYIQLDGPNVASLVIKSEDEEDTIASTEYYVDAINGRVFAVPGGDLDEEDLVVHVAYQYTPPAKKRLRLGANLPIIDRSIKVTHVSTLDRMTIVYHLWKCNGQGTLEMALKKKEWWSVALDMVATPDYDNHPDEPFGYIDFIPFAA
jgi:hypothetical protein